MKKKMAVVVAAALVSTTLLAACSNNGNEKNSLPNSETSSNEQTTNTSTEPSTKASQEPLDLSIFYFDGSGVVKMDSPVLTKAAELTNISLNNVAPAGGEEKQAYNLMLASGSLPDLISYYISDLNSIGSEDALAPLNEYIDKFAPNFKKFLEENEDVRKAITAADGNIYTIPSVADGTASTGWFIRQDWLDKLNLQSPTTVDQYYEVLKAFRDQDPNGNGKKDEVPYMQRDNVVGAYSLLPLWDAYHSFYIKENKIVFGPYEDQFEIGISNIAKWYAEGLIDKEIYTRAKARETLLGNNTAGSTHDWFASTSNFNNSLKDQVPGLNLIPFAPPASSSGKVFEVGKRAKLTGFGWGISANSKHIEEAVKYFDFWWTEEGRRMFNFGIEDQSYKLVDGKPIFTEEVLSQPAVNGYLVEAYGAQLTKIGAWQDFSYEEQWTNEIALKGIKLYQDNNLISSDYTLPPLSFTQEEQERITDLKGQIDTYFAEKAQKWVMGGEEVASNFAAYKDELKKLGVDEYIQIYNDAYTRYLNMK
ncbi:putative aldouronate transport system substrate-binding protein [Paenibacillus phyllosphaerae]|uniref:Putative aldouronate transport system substrate-binding protein n=1 Tax=Paenibacillus phyllosphaerae TaxID=274593 RepID=A0A7W5B0S3_9BACL|nr:extracellular solute-binding protein [Paenibacillus phyllosphaerae]MBB3112142.1 putative aldouronate transport system substrate-binding protein [Paenibacillus phyllosphaerae]